MGKIVYISLKYCPHSPFQTPVAAICKHSTGACWWPSWENSESCYTRTVVGKALLLIRWYAGREMVGKVLSGVTGGPCCTMLNGYHRPGPFPMKSTWDLAIASGNKLRRWRVNLDLPSAWSKNVLSYPRLIFVITALSPQFANYHILHPHLHSCVSLLTMCGGEYVCIVCVCVCVAI